MKGCLARMQGGSPPTIKGGNGGTLNGPEYVFALNSAGRSQNEEQPKAIACFFRDSIFTHTDTGLSSERIGG
jgi:hypothetical protein